MAFIQSKPWQTTVTNNLKLEHILKIIINIKIIIEFIIINIFQGVTLNNSSRYKNNIPIPGFLIGPRIFSLLSINWDKNIVPLSQEICLQVQVSQLDRTLTLPKVQDHAYIDNFF